MCTDPLSTLTQELRRRALETARQRGGRLAGLTIRVPSHINTKRQSQALAEALRGDGLVDLAITVLCGPGPAEILSMEFER